MTTRLPSERKRLAPILALAAVVPGLAASAEAQPSAADRGLAGHWTFETDVATEYSCTVTGNATLTPTGSGRYVVELATVENCRVGGAARSLQYCNAVQRGDGVRVTCAIIRSSDANYLPDDFVLQVVNAEAMRGEIVSAWNAPARWRRTRPDLVS